MFFNIRTVIGQNIILIPVEQHTLLNRLLIFIGIVSPDNDISQVAGFHTGFIYPVRVRNDIQFYIEFFQHNLTEPSDLFSGIVGKLIKYIQSDCFLRNDFFQKFVIGIPLFTGLGIPSGCFSICFSICLDSAVCHRLRSCFT